MNHHCGISWLGERVYILSSAVAFISVRFQTAVHYTSARMVSKSSALRQCRQEDLEEIWAPVKGYQLVKAEVISNFRLHQLAPSHVKLARGILLFGPSGTGKTEMARCIGRQFGATGNFHSVNSSDVISAYRGESGLNMKIVFDKAKEQEGVSGIDPKLTVTIQAHTNETIHDQNIAIKSRLAKHRYKHKHKHI